MLDFKHIIIYEKTMIIPVNFVEIENIKAKPETVKELFHLWKTVAKEPISKVKISYEVHLIEKFILPLAFIKKYKRSQGNLKEKYALYGLPLAFNP